MQTALAGIAAAELVAVGQPCLAVPVGVGLWLAMFWLAREGLAAGLAVRVGFAGSGTTILAAEHWRPARPCGWVWSCASCCGVAPAAGPPVRVLLLTGS